MSGSNKIRNLAVMNVFLLIMARGKFDLNWLAFFKWWRALRRMIQLSPSVKLPERLQPLAIGMVNGGFKRGRLVLVLLLTPWILGHYWHLTSTFGSFKLILHTIFDAKGSVQLFGSPSFCSHWAKSESSRPSFPSHFHDHPRIFLVFILES